MTIYMMYFAIGAFVALAACALIYLQNRHWGQIGLIVVIPLIGLAALGLGPLLLSDEPPTETPPAVAAPMPVTAATFKPFRPIEQASDGYVNASACMECHKDNYHSWHNSYHRTMTQLATADNVMGDFDGQVVSFDGHDYRMIKEDDMCWVDVPTSVLNLNEQQSVAAGETSRLPIVMTTGSHHMQVYWFPMGQGRVLGQFPLVYLKNEQRWVPRKSCFLEPPSTQPSIEMGRWNNTCLQCHSTHPKQKLSRNFVFSTTVAEFGISCEACHGPGQDHIAFHRNPAANDSNDDPIVNPDQLDHRLSSQVCGNCHSMSTHLDTDTRNNGHAYRPGKSLSTSRHIFRCNPQSEAVLKEQGHDPQEFFDSVFWKDGMVRVSGREFNGLEESACFKQGTMSCLSCHAVHQEQGDTRSPETWANDQLAVGMETDKACTQCHDANDYGQAHTHHDASSGGSRCYNCHMPHTTYGLLKAMRSHQISSPHVQNDQQAGRPNACNLCHLDQSLSWTANHLSQWYDIETPELDQTDSELAAGVLWALRGDAGIRAIVGWHMGWKSAQQASGAAWMGRYLAHLLSDPYDVVRYIAGKSLRSIPEFNDFEYDYVAPLTNRLARQSEAVRLWERLQRSGKKDSARLLINPNGKLKTKEFSGLASQRDDRDMLLNE